MHPKQAEESRKQMELCKIPLSKPALIEKQGSPKKKHTMQSFEIKTLKALVSALQLG
jgi:hypothetical protein